MGNEARKKAGAAAAAPPAPDDGGKGEPATPASSQPREYVVFREVKITADLATALNVPLLSGAVVLAELGTVEAKTPKEARRTVAKAKLDEDELRTDNGVPLRAITKSAATAGRGVAKLKVEPTWDD